MACRHYGRSQECYRPCLGCMIFVGPHPGAWSRSDLRTALPSSVPPALWLVEISQFDFYALVGRSSFADLRSLGSIFVERLSMEQILPPGAGYPYGVLSSALHRCRSLGRSPRGNLSGAPSGICAGDRPASGEPCRAFDRCPRWLELLPGGDSRWRAGRLRQRYASGGSQLFDRQVLCACRPSVRGRYPHLRGPALDSDAEAKELECRGDSDGRGFALDRGARWDAHCRDRQAGSEKNVPAGRTPRDRHVGEVRRGDLRSHARRCRCHPVRAG